MSFRFREAWVAFGLFALVADLGAQTVTYVRDIPLPAGHSFILPVSGTPLAGSTPSQLLMTTSEVYSLNYATGTFAVMYSEVPGTNLLAGSLAASIPGSPTLMLTGRAFALYTFGYTDGVLESRGLDFVYPNANNTLLAVNGTAVIVANNSIYSYRLDQQQSTILVGTHGTAPGQIATAGAAAMGPDGLLYLLDQADGVNRIQRFDLSAGLAEADRFRGSFNLVAGIDSLMGGMAISAQGRIYLGDGLGGGDVYDLAGNFLGDFGASFAGGLGDNGKAFLNLDALGNILVYTPDTGLHQYFDPSALTAVPEPSVYAALSGVLALSAALFRRKQLASSVRFRRVRLL